MNRILILLSILLVSISASAQTPFKGADYIYYYQVGIGKTNGSLTTPSAWVEIGKDSTNKGFRLPRVVDTANITAPVYGLQVYQIKDNSIYFRDKNAWRRSIDANIISQYLPKADSTTYYPYWSNPRNYVSTESDPVANAKTVRWIPGDGILINNSAAQPLSTNPVATITANNNAAMWNANALQGSPIAGIVPTTGQFLSYNGSQYVPTSPPIAGTVNSVGLALPSAVFDITGSPVTNTGTLTGAFKNQLANLVFASPNGISGPPSFRSILYPDLPISGVAPGTYGNDTVSPKITFNDRGVSTSAGTSNLSSFFVRLQGAYSQVGNMNISGFGVLNNLFTNAGTGGASQSHLTMRANNATRISLGLTGIESVSNNGSDFIINRFDDGGAFLGNLLYGRRSDGFVGIGNTSPNYKLSVQAGITYSDGFATSISNKATNVTASLTNETVLNITVNGVTVTLPTAAPANFGKIYTILKDFTGGRAYVTSNSIDGAPTYNLGDTIKGITVISDGAAWKVASTKNILTGSGGGAVTSVGLSAPSEFSVSGSPITTSGTLTISKSNQSANTVYAGPASGSAAAPAFRSLVPTDIPLMSPGTPSFTPNGQTSDILGTGYSINITGNGDGMRVVITTGTSIVTTGTIGQIFFSTPYVNTPYTVYSASNLDAVGTTVSFTSITNAYILVSNKSLLLPSTVYSYTLVTSR